MSLRKRMLRVELKDSDPNVTHPQDPVNLIASVALAGFATVGLALIALILFLVMVR